MGTFTGSSFSAPKLNGQALERIMYKGIMENIFQNIIHLPGKGVTEKYTEDTNASEVRIIRELPVTGNARKLGSSINGGNFNANNPEQPQSAEYGIRLLYVYDNCFDIPTVQQDMVSLDLAEAAQRNIGGKIATEINASTTAHQLVTSFNYNALRTTPNDKMIKLANGASGEDYKDAILDAAALLDSGDEDNGIQVFPYDARQIIARPSFKRQLLAKGALIIGGSNYAQEMLARGVISPGTYKDEGRAYVGEVDNTPVMIMSDQIWTAAANWMQKDTSGTKTTVDLQYVLAIVVSGIGTGRGLAFNNGIKIIDAPNGQGKRLQPLYRWGVEVFYPASVVPIVAYSFSNPAVASTSTVEVIAPGERASTLDTYINVTGVKIGVDADNTADATLTNGVWANSSNLAAATASAYVEIVTTAGTVIAGNGTHTVGAGNNYIQGVVTANGAFETVNINVKVASL